MLELAKQELHSARYATYKSTQIKNTAVSVKNEVMEMIARIVLPVFILSAMVFFIG